MAENESRNQTTIYEVQKWLEKLHGDDSRLFLQPEEQDKECLLDLKCKNEEAENIITEEIKIKEYLNQFYNNKTEEMKKLIESENVTLSEEAEEFVEKIASLGAKMNLAEPDLTNFLMAICDVKDKQLKCQEQMSVDCHTLSSLSKKIANIQKQNRVIERDLEALEETVKIQEYKGEKLSNSLSFMKVKQQDYERLCNKIEKYLDHSGYDSSIRHNTLVKKSEVVKALEKQYKENLKHLESYKSLPPNETLAKLELQKKLEELKEVEQTFSELLESLQNNEYVK